MADIVSQEVVTAKGEQAVFVDTTEVLRRIPISRRTLTNWRDKGKIPFVRMGGRRILFHWPSLQQALLRQQRNVV